MAMGKRTKPIRTVAEVQLDRYELINARVSR